MEEKKIQKCFLLKPDLVKRIEEIAKETGRTKSGLVGLLLEEALEKFTTKS